MVWFTVRAMLRSFRHRGLSALWHRGSTAGVRPDLLARIQLRLDALNAATQPQDLNVPGFNFHRLHGKPTRFAIHVNGPWCMTFEWDGEDAIRVDLEQYH